MKKMIFLFIPFFFFSIKAFSVEPEAIYKIMKNFYQNYPDTFTCEIDGDKLRSSIASIPKDAVLDPKKMKIRLLFHKQWGSRVILEGVNEAFKDRFSYIEGVFEFIMPFMTNADYASFANKYVIFDGKKTHFKLKKKNTEGSFLEISFQENPSSIPEVKEYKKEELITNISIEYEKIDGYSMPVRLQVRYYEDSKVNMLKFNLTNFNFKPKISEEDFLG